MSKILLLSTIYPAPDIHIGNNTNVVHYFAREWIKQGHEVLVIHNYPIYMRIFHWLGKLSEKMIASKFNTLVTSVYQKKYIEYEMDGVRIIRMPLYKPLPRFTVPKSQMHKRIIDIVNYCNLHNFIPDIITAHNYYPHLPLVNQLKEKYYPNATTCIVVHKQTWKMLNYCGKDYKKEIKKIDIWGYRSLPLKQEFENNTGVIPKKYFMCYSGIPEHFFKCNQICSINKPINRFIYVGSFIRRKYPEKLLFALKESNLTDFRLDYVGDGVNRKLVEHIIKKNSWQKKVILHGLVEREKVPTYIQPAQCFIMISKQETFGLVYLEAMSMGCLTIASRGEGMEGIIKNGINGFLCEAGNQHELASIINHLNEMTNEELLQISQNARNTARHMTDAKVAADYINSILN